MSKPDDAEGQESVWARYEREDREEAKRARGPNRLIWTGFSLVVIANLAHALGRPLPDAVFWVLICLAVGLGTAGLAWLWSRRRRA